MSAVKARVQLHKEYATFHVIKDDEVSEYFNKIREMEDTSFNERTYEEQRKVLMRRKYGNQAEAAPLEDSRAWTSYSI